MKKRLKSVAAIALSLFCIVSLSGCKFLDWYTHEIENGIISVREKADKRRLELAQIIVDCFKEKDADGLMGVLCPKTQEISDIREQIETSFQFLKGNITSYEISPDEAYEGWGADDGIVDEYDASQFVVNIATDNGEEYEIHFHFYYRNQDKNREGVTWVAVTNNGGTDANEDNITVEIGYWWNSNYQYESASVVSDAVKAISDGDADALKKTFSAKLLKNDDIEKQMPAAFDFFEGSATFGLVADKRGETYHDGDHDFYNAKLIDYVVLEDYRPISIYIEVMTVNIETDTGKKYSIEWSAYLLNDVDPESKGILQMVLIDGDKRCAIG